MKNLECMNENCLLRLPNGTCVDENRPRVCNDWKPTDKQKEYDETLSKAFKNMAFELE